MKEIIIGLAGHIDHGKTSLIKSPTNEFSGSLKEDLKRGMTVDLGIAFLNQKITLIDVPGHENFIKNMISGSHGIDVGLLVIAADDGPMPQTIEHLNIFKLLISDWNCMRNLLLVAPPSTYNSLMGLFISLDIHSNKSST